MRYALGSPIYTMIRDRRILRNHLWVNIGDEFGTVRRNDIDQNVFRLNQGRMQSWYTALQTGPLTDGVRHTTSVRPSI